VEFRKTHDLNELLTLFHVADPALQTELDSCVWLTPYGVEFRYPGDYSMVDVATAKQALGAVQLVKAVLVKRLHPFLSQGRPA